MLRQVLRPGLGRAGAGGVVSYLTHLLLSPQTKDVAPPGNLTWLGFLDIVVCRCMALCHQT